MTKNNNKNSENGTPSEEDLKQALEAIKKKKELREEKERKELELKEKSADVVLDLNASDTKKQAVALGIAKIHEQVDKVAKMLKDSFPEINIEVKVENNGIVFIKLDLKSMQADNKIRQMYLSSISSQFKDLFGSSNPIRTQGGDLSIEFQYARDQKENFILREESQKRADDILKKTSQGFRSEFDKRLNELKLAKNNPASIKKAASILELKNKSNKEGDDLNDALKKAFTTPVLRNRDKDKDQWTKTESDDKEKVVQNGIKACMQKLEEEKNMSLNDKSYFLFLIKDFKFNIEDKYYFTAVESEDLIDAIYDKSKAYIESPEYEIDNIKKEIFNNTQMIDAANDQLKKISIPEKNASIQEKNQYKREKGNSEAQIRDYEHRQENAKKRLDEAQFKRSEPEPELADTKKGPLEKTNNDSLDHEVLELKNAFNLLLNKVENNLGKISYVEEIEEYLSKLNEKIIMLSDNEDSLSAHIVTELKIDQNDAREILSIHLEDLAESTSEIDLVATIPDSEKFLADPDFEVPFSLDNTEEKNLVADLEARLNEAKARLETVQEKYKGFTNPNSVGANKTKKELIRAAEIVNGLEENLADAKIDNDDFLSDKIWDVAKLNEDIEDDLLEYAPELKTKEDDESFESDKVILETDIDIDIGIKEEVKKEELDKIDDVLYNKEQFIRIEYSQEDLINALKVFNDGDFEEVKGEYQFSGNHFPIIQSFLALEKMHFHVYQEGKLYKITHYAKEYLNNVFLDLKSRTDTLESTGSEREDQFKVDVLETIKIEDKSNEKQILRKDDPEWGEAENFFKNNPTEVKFSKKIKDRDPNFNHSFIKVGDEIFAIANRKIIGEEKAGLLGEGTFGKVKMVQAKDGSRFAVKIEGRGARAEDDTENKVMKLIDYVQGEVERDLEHEKEFLGQFTSKKLYTITKLRKGIELFEAICFDPNLSQRDFLTEEQKLRIALESCKAISDLHSLGVIHADIKPENFMADINGNQIVIESIDYGHSMILPEGEFEIQAVEAIGSEGYIAPEVVSKKIYSPASDIYALGSMLKDDLKLSNTNNSTLARLINEMLDEDPLYRPEMSTIISTLNDEIVLRDKALREIVDYLINKQLPQSSADQPNVFYIGGENELTESQLDMIQFFLDSENLKDSIKTTEQDDLFEITPEAQSFLQDYLSHQPAYVDDYGLEEREVFLPEEAIPAYNDLMISALKAKTQDGYTMLTDAIKAGKVDALNDIIDKYEHYYPNGLYEHILEVTKSYSLNPLQIAVLSKNVDVFNRVVDLYLEFTNANDLFWDATESKTTDGQNIFMLAAAGENSAMIDALKARLIHNPDLIEELILHKDKDGNNALNLAAALGSSQSFKAMYDLYQDYAPLELEKNLFDKIENGMGVIKAASYSEDDDMLKAVLEAAYKHDAEKYKEQIKYIIDNDDSLWNKIGDVATLNEDIEDYLLEYALEFKAKEYNEFFDEVKEELLNLKNSDKDILETDIDTDVEAREEVKKEELDKIEAIPAYNDSMISALKAKTQDGYTMLTAAIKHGKVDALDEIIMHYSNYYPEGLREHLLSTELKNNFNALHIAMLTKNVDIFNKVTKLYLKCDNTGALLLDAVKAKSSDGQNIFMLAEAGKNSAMIDALRARLINNPELIKTLLKDTVKTHNMESNALMLSAVSGSSENFSKMLEIYKLYVPEEVEKNLFDKNSIFVIKFAYSSEDPNMLKTVLETMYKQDAEKYKEKIKYIIENDYRFWYEIMDVATLNADIEDYLKGYDEFFDEVVKDLFDPVEFEDEGPDDQSVKKNEALLIGTTDQGWSLLTYAISSGDTEKVNNALAKYKEYYPEGLTVHLNLKTLDHDLNPLHIAILSKNSEMLNTVIDFYKEQDSTGAMLLDAMKEKTKDGQNIFTLAAADKEGKMLDLLRSAHQKILQENEEILKHDIQNKSLIELLNLAIAQEDKNKIENVLAIANELNPQGFIDAIKAFRHENNDLWNKVISYLDDEIIEELLEVEPVVEPVLLKSASKRFLPVHNKDNLLKKNESNLEEKNLKTTQRNKRSKSVSEQPSKRKSESRKSTPFISGQKDLTKSMSVSTSRKPVLTLTEESDKPMTQPESGLSNQTELRKDNKTFTPFKNSSELPKESQSKSKEPTLIAITEARDIDEDFEETKEELLNLENSDNDISEIDTVPTSDIKLNQQEALLFSNKKDSNLDNLQVGQTERKIPFEFRQSLETNEMAVSGPTLVANTEVKKSRPESTNNPRSSKVKPYSPHFDSNSDLSKNESTGHLSEKFVKKLKKEVFLEKDWQYTHKDEKLTISSLNQQSPKEISIKPIPNGLLFSGTNGAESDIVKAAEAYEKVNKKAGKETTFQIYAKTPEEAKLFLQKIVEGGFDMNKIDAINYGDHKLQGEALATFKHDNMPQPQTKARLK